MTSYAALLGHQPRISLAELAASLPDFTFRRMAGKHIAVFETSADIAPKHLAQWGGTILIARQIVSADVGMADLPNILATEAEKLKGKITFSLRAVGVPPSLLRSAFRDCKLKLSKMGRASRYVGNERKPAATALLHDAGLLDGKHGCELTILADEDFFWVGRTLAAQDIDAYTMRDMDKPVRDTRVGLLPPKLAQIMLNFGLWLANDGCEKPLTTLRVFDPFCGTGVIPMEALVRKWPVLASDVSLKAVNGCEKNLEWIRKKYDIKKRDVPSLTWKQDALKSFALKEQPDVVVSETTLGPPLTARPTVKEAAKIRSECEKTEIAFLKNAAATLPGIPLVLTLPVWFLRTGTVWLEKLLRDLPALGYTAVLPHGIEPEIPERPTLLYRRPDQFVGRELLLLRPVKRR